MGSISMSSVLNLQLETLGETQVEMDAPGKPAAVDPEVLADLRRCGAELGRDVLGEIVELYLEQGPALTDTIDRAVASRRSEEIQKAAHSLAANSRSLGASYLSLLCGTLERLAWYGDFERCEPWARSVREEYLRVEKELGRALEWSGG